MKELFSVALLLAVAVGLSQGLAPPSPSEQQFLIKGNERYLIVAPRLFQNGSTYDVSVTFYNVTENIDVVLKVNEKHHRHGSKMLKVIASAQVTISPKQDGEQVLVGMKMPSMIKASSANLRVEANSKNGLKLVLIRRISKKESHAKLFIQSDKAIYKPGENVRFRVVAVKPNLKPGDGELTEVYVKNPTGTRMIQWKNVALETGFASFSMKLSKKPLLGSWIIEAHYMGKKVEKRISIEKYVLPKIEVSIKAPSTLLFRRTNFEVNVCAKYTYGKPAKGKAVSTFCLQRRWWRRFINKEKYSCVQVVQKIKGCADVAVLYPDLGTLRYTYGYHMFMNVSFKEDGTNLKFKATHTITSIVYKDIKLSFDGTPNHFKPGFAFVGQLKLTTREGRPIIGTRKVKITARSINGILFYQEKNVNNGLLKFDIEPDSRMEYISLVAEYKDTRKETPIHYRMATASKRISSWYSPSKNYIIVKQPKQPLAVGKKAAIYIEGTGDGISGNKVSYTMYCRGKASLHGKFDVYFESKKSFKGKIMFPVTFSMVPKCRLLAYYVRRDGEFVADAVIVDIEDTFKNQVSLKFSDTQRKPGEKVSLEIKAYPGSRFALSAVDKSVQLLAKNNDLRSKDIMNILESQDVGRSYYGFNSKCSGWPGRIYHDRVGRSIMPYPRDNFVDGTKALQDSGVVYLSNLKVDVKPCPKYIHHSFDRTIEVTRGIAKNAGLPGPSPPLQAKPTLNREKVEFKNTKAKVAKVERIRKDFPETWLWTEEYVSNKTGSKVIRAAVPDTLTTWYANAFAASQVAGVGVAKTSSLLVFQPFFVSLALPYSVIRGEKVEIPATVFNYLDDCLSIQLTLKKSNAYTILSETVLTTCVCSDDATTARFTIVPKGLGKIPIVVKALTVTTNQCKGKKMGYVAAADAISKKLLVEAEGIKKESTFNSFICVNGTTNVQKHIQLGLPNNYVKGSVYATFSVFGDLMGPSLTNLDKLLAMPYGCGEQNMLNFAPNIYILDYLTKSGQLTSGVKGRAIEYMRIGYQRELTYRRKDGSYSAFGNRDKEGSTWLTAFVVRSFGEARRYITIDEQDILKSRAWLLRQQKSDGCFKDVGMVHHRELKGGVKGEATMTAFVLLSLLETGLKKTDPRVAHALKCVTKDLTSVNDPYTAAILAYTLTLADSQHQSSIITILKRLATSADGMTFWEAKSSSKRDDSPWYIHRRARSADIEMTAYALMTYLKTQKYTSAVPIIRWLAKQRNSLGGFSSTQDTCIALKALSQNAQKTGAKEQKVNIKMVAPDITHTFDLNEGNKLVLQRVELPKVPGNVNVDVSGTGCSLIQTNVKFNEEKEKAKPAFSLDVSVSPVDIFNCRHNLKICARYNKGTSNMALIDVQMVSGFEPVTSDLDKILQSTKNILLKDYEFSGNMLNLYFHEIGESRVCVDFAMEEKQRVDNRKPAPIKVYDYYDTSKSATVMHEVKDCLRN